MIDPAPYRDSDGSRKNSNSDKSKNNSNSNSDSISNKTPEFQRSNEPVQIDMGSIDQVQNNPARRPSDNTGDEQPEQPQEDPTISELDKRPIPDEYDSGPKILGGIDGAIAKAYADNLESTLAYINKRLAKSQKKLAENT